MSVSAEERLFLSVAQLGERLGVSTRTAYNLVNERVVPYIEIRGVKRIPVVAFDLWLAEREREALAAVLTPQTRDAAPWRPGGSCRRDRHEKRRA